MILLLSLDNSFSKAIERILIMFDVLESWDPELFEAEISYFAEVDPHKIHVDLSIGIRGFSR